MFGKIKNEITQYVMTHDQVKKELDTALKNANENYVGAMLAQKTGEAKEAYRAYVEPLRNAAVESVTHSFESLLKSVNDIVCKPAPLDALNSIQMLQTAGKVSEQELKAFLDQYRGNYMVGKLLHEIAAKHKIELPEVFTYADAIMEDLHDLENEVSYLLYHYEDGNVYRYNNVLSFKMVNRIEDEYKAFVGGYQVPDESASA